VEAAAFMYFEVGGQAQKLIHSFKYHGNNQLAEFLGKIAAKNLEKDGVFCEVDCFVPVPLHPRKKRQRGYNQAEWIAQGLAAVYQKTVCADVLHRCVYADSQTKKSIIERQQNVENAFEVRDGKRLEGKHVVLVDDVITSGSTTNACLQALLTIPKIKVSIFSIGIVPVRQSTDDFDPMDDAPPDDTEIIVF
jgi:ComF family protein